jgi:hypothetical protein
LLVATIGSYGVISYSVAQRSGNWSSYSPWSGEIRHFRVVIGQGLRMDMAGVTVGGTVALLLMRVLSSFSHLLYGVGTNDPTRCVAVSLMLIGRGCFSLVSSGAARDSGGPECRPAL